MYEMIRVAEFINLCTKNKSTKDNKILVLAICRFFRYTFQNLPTNFIVGVYITFILRRGKKKKRHLKNCPLHFVDNMGVTFLSSGRMLALPLVGLEKLSMIKREFPIPGQCVAQFVGELSCVPKVCQFNSPSRHIPGLQF